MPTSRRRPGASGLCALITTIALLTATPAPALAGGGTVVDMGLRKTAMQAIIGRPDEAAAVFHNPAGLTYLKGTQVYLSFAAAFIGSDFRLRPWACSGTGAQRRCLSDKLLGQQTDAEGFYPKFGPDQSFGFIPMVVITSSLFTPKLVGALSLYVPNAIGASFAEDSTARFHLVRGFFIAGNATFSLAYEIAPWVSVGAGISVVHVRFSGRRKFFPVVKLGGSTVDLTSFIGTKAELELGGSDWAPGWNAGVLFKPLRWLSIGAAVIGRVDVEMKGEVTLSAGDDALLPSLKNKTVRGDLVTTGRFLPWTLHFGANVDIGRHVEVGAELRYFFFKDFVEQVGEVTLDDPALAALIKRLPFPKEYGDSWQISGGVKVRIPGLEDLEVMAGYHYDKSPAPDHTVSVEDPSFDHMGIHLGARYRFLDDFRIGLAYSHWWYLQRDVTTSVTQPPTNFIGSGTNNMVMLVFEARVARGIGVAASPTPPPAGGY